MINYSLHVTGIPISDVRRDFSMAIMGGIDEVNYRKLEKSGNRSPMEIGSRGRRPEIPAFARLLGSQRQHARGTAAVAGGDRSVKRARV